MLRTHSSACSEISCRIIHGQRLDGASTPNLKGCQGLPDLNLELKGTIHTPMRTGYK